LAPKRSSLPQMTIPPPHAAESNLFGGLKSEIPLRPQCFPSVDGLCVDKNIRNPALHQDLSRGLVITTRQSFRLRSSSLSESASGNSGLAYRGRDPHSVQSECSCCPSFTVKAWTSQTSLRSRAPWEGRRDRYRRPAPYRACRRLCRLLALQHD